MIKNPRIMLSLFVKYSLVLLVLIYSCQVDKSRPSKRTDSLMKYESVESLNNSKFDSINNYISENDLLIETDGKRKSLKDSIETFIVDGFSKYYYGEVKRIKYGESEGSGWIGIYSKKYKNRLIKVKSESIGFEFHDGRITTNVKEIYGEQSLIMYEDFNFDGIKDFAIQEGRNGCYGAPSYFVYLVFHNKIIYNRKFTELAQNYCGMFVVDHKRKLLLVFTKSGPGYHEYREYRVVNNVPKVVLIIEEEFIDENNFIETTKRLLKNGKWSKKTIKGNAEDNPR